MARVRNLKYQNQIVEQPKYNGVELTKWIHDGVVVWENGYSGDLSQVYVFMYKKPCLYNPKTKTLVLTGEMTWAYYYGDYTFQKEYLAAGHGYYGYKTKIVDSIENNLMVAKDLDITVSGNRLLACKDGLIATTEDLRTGQYYEVDRENLKAELMTEEFDTITNIMGIPISSLFIPSFVQHPSCYYNQTNSVIRLLYATKDNGMNVYYLVYQQNSDGTNETIAEYHLEMAGSYWGTQWPANGLALKNSNLVAMSVNGKFISFITFTEYLDTVPINTRMLCSVVNSDGSNYCEGYNIEEIDEHLLGIRYDKHNHRYLGYYYYDDESQIYELDPHSFSRQTKLSLPDYIDIPISGSSSYDTLRMYSNSSGNISTDKCWNVSMLENMQYYKELGSYTYYDKEGCPSDPPGMMLYVPNKDNHSSFSRNGMVYIDNLVFNASEDNKAWFL